MDKAELIKQIQAANEAYSAGIPFMTDTDYDVLWQNLYSIDPDNPNLYHTARNAPTISGAITHRYPIFGTAKAFNTTDMSPFLTRFGSRQLVIEPKYDGCAAVLELTSSGWQLALEGDGIRGADITFLLPYISTLFNLRHFQAIEILIPWDVWDQSYGKNPRNTVSGWTNPLRKEPPPPDIMTAIPHAFGPLSHPYTYDGNIDLLNETLLHLHTEWKEIYPIDGLMIKVANEEERLIIGTDGPRNAWSLAWKPPIQTSTTTVTNIEWNVSRLGRIIPTVVYEPIELCGTTNTRVTGNNAQWILDRQIMVGSTLLVGKAGEIIPKIVKVFQENPDTLSKEQTTPQEAQNTAKKAGLGVPGTTICPEKSPAKNAKFSAKKLSLPGLCPICAAKLSWDGVHLICSGETCLAKLIVSLSYFYSSKGIKIDGIGESKIEKILSDPKCYKVLRDQPWALLDMFTYNITTEVINTIGSRTFYNLIEQINTVSGTRTIAHFISGLGLPGLGYKTTLRLCQFLKSGQLNIHVSEKAKNNFIQAVSKYQQALDELKNFTFADLPKPAKAIYCVTGTLSMSREAFVEQNYLLEYEFSNTVTRETNYLIIGEEPGKTKIKKAQKYNIPIITEDQFNKIITGE